MVNIMKLVEKASKIGGGWERQSYFFVSFGLGVF